MGKTGEKTINLTIQLLHGNNLQSFMLFAIIYANFVKNFSFTSLKDALTTLKQDDTINLT